MEENNEEKLSTLFNNRFVESLNRAIENKNNRISELEEKSKIINRKSVLIDYSSQLLTGISYTDLINELIEKIKQNPLVNSVSVENRYLNGHSCLSLVINLDHVEIDIDDNESYLVAYPTLYVPITNPTSTLSSLLLSNNNSSFTDVINDQNEISFEEFKGLVTNIDIGRINLCLDRGSNYISRDLEYFGNEEIMEKSIEEKIDFIIQQVTNKEFLLQLIRSERLYIGESSFITPRNPSIVKNSKSVISELLEVLKICEIEEETENE